MTQPVEVAICARTDVGLVRDHNEDTVLIADLSANEPLPDDGSGQAVASERGPVMIVCDGMGGMAGGEVASELACDIIYQDLQGAQSSPQRDVVARLLRRAVRRANHVVRTRSDETLELRGMGTTASVAALAGTTLVVANVGDSRAYVLRGEDLVQVTRDQSVVSALVSAGKLTESQARFSVQRSVVLQAVGAEADVAVSLSIVELRAGDRLLLCSDGLHGCVFDGAIAAALGRGKPEEACATLHERARQGGAPDNVTVVVADFGGEVLEVPEAGEKVEFRELDPSESGSEAVTSTSKVARKLAARAGIIDEAPANEVPATGMHPAIRDHHPPVSPPTPGVGPAEA
ncbi:MAG: protein phosphatase 2C domain-containing protein, partial [Deltaproteobacteria bacterium]|nr:protein phosphatase 2C domain-containing protein [Deltaproteobacteria bacterium]